MLRIVADLAERDGERAEVRSMGAHPEGGEALELAVRLPIVGLAGGVVSRP
jgi:hypothetical protein